MTATVETVVEQLDLAPIILTEKIIPVAARPVTIPENESSKNLQKDVNANRINKLQSFLSNCTNKLFYRK